MASLSTWSKMAVEAIVLLRRIDHRLRNIEDMAAAITASKVYPVPEETARILAGIMKENSDDNGS